MAILALHSLLTDKSALSTLNSVKDNTALSGAGGLAAMCARCDHQALLPQWDSFSKTEKGLRNFRAGPEAKGICLLLRNSKYFRHFYQSIS